MPYKPSPRPTFSGPEHIPYAGVTRHLWGDSTSGEVSDWIYVSSDKIHQLVFGLAPGQCFRHSEDFRTVFAADEVYYVLQGLLVINNPETGEVHRVNPGEAVFFPRDTWHYGFNYGHEPLRVLEYFAPPPSQGTSGAYARTRPNLSMPKYSQEQWLGQWPAGRAEARQADRMKVLREDDSLWRLEGTAQQVLVSIWASTPRLTVGKVHLLPGQHTEQQQHGGDEALYLLSGKLNVRLPDQEGQSWYELNERDGFYLPEGTAHQYYNLTDSPVTLLFGIAPSYQ